MKYQPARAAAPASHTQFGIPATDSSVRKSVLVVEPDELVELDPDPLAVVELPAGGDAGAGRIVAAVIAGGGGGAAA